MKLVWFEEYWLVSQLVLWNPGRQEAQLFSVQSRRLVFKATVLMVGTAPAALQRASATRSRCKTLVFGIPGLPRTACIDPVEQAGSHLLLLGRM